MIEVLSLKKEKQAGKLRQFLFPKLFLVGLISKMLLKLKVIAFGCGNDLSVIHANTLPVWKRSCKFDITTLEKLEVTWQLKFSQTEHDNNFLLICFSIYKIWEKKQNLIVSWYGQRCFCLRADKTQKLWAFQTFHYFSFKFSWTKLEFRFTERYNFGKRFYRDFRR